MKPDSMLQPQRGGAGLLAWARVGDPSLARFGGALSRWLLYLMVCTSFWATGPLLASERSGPCEDGDAGRAGAQLDCVTDQQLGKILAYRNPTSDEPLMRKALAAAFDIADCINDFRLLPEAQQRKDFHCLQHRLLDFYEQISQPETQPSQLHFQDLLAWASLRIHYCMIDEDLPVSRCLTLVEKALKDYQSVFRAAAQIQTDPESSSSVELAETMGMSIKFPAPDFSRLEAFVDLSLKNSLRFPMALGRQIGTALGPVLCDAYQLYPDRRAYIAYHYNLLIRFDGGNMAASGRLYQFVEHLREFFRPAPGMPSFLQLRPANFSTSPLPCSVEDWILAFPEFVVLPGYRLPGKQKLEQALTGLEAVLAQSAEFVDPLSSYDLAKYKTHLWKPFYRYGTLLFRLAQSLKIASSRDQQMWETRHLLMEKARDALLLRAVEPGKHPRDPKTLQASISQQIRTYGEELLSELQFDPLIDFAEEYLEAGEGLLSELQKQRLHRLLAIVYAVREKRSKALAHLQKSNLQLAELEKIREKFREVGV
ncbi:hypothetical protein MYX65_12445, partial [Acidobacteria bacterium AH-259-L09]|nr:hypothetical protein [Acidobacteria bacterium AH-259-L09]